MISLVVLILIAYVATIVKIHNACVRKNISFDPTEDTAGMFVIFIVGTLVSLCVIIWLCLTYLP